MSYSSSRCPWAQTPLNVVYHDTEWGVPLHDDRRLFEMLCLEGAQAGLSWDTILRKRQNYRAAFDGFDPVKVAAYDEAKCAKLLLDEGNAGRIRLAARGRLARPAPEPGPCRRTGHRAAATATRRRRRWAPRAPDRGRTSAPRLRATSTSLFALELVREPTTRTSVASSQICLTASCRFWVA